MHAHAEQESPPEWRAGLEQGLAGRAGLGAASLGASPAVANQLLLPVSGQASQGFVWSSSESNCRTITPASSSELLGRACSKRSLSSARRSACVSGRGGGRGEGGGGEGGRGEGGGGGGGGGSGMNMGWKGVGERGDGGRGGGDGGHGGGGLSGDGGSDMLLLARCAGAEEGVTARTNRPRVISKTTGILCCRIHARATPISGDPSPDGGPDALGDGGLSCWRSSSALRFVPPPLMLRVVRNVLSSSAASSSWLVSRWMTTCPAVAAAAIASTDEKASSSPSSSSSLFTSLTSICLSCSASGSGTASSSAEEDAGEGVRGLRSGIGRVALSARIVNGSSSSSPPSMLTCGRQGAEPRIRKRKPAERQVVHATRCVGAQAQTLAASFSLSHGIQSHTSSTLCLSVRAYTQARALRGLAHE